MSSSTPGSLTICREQDDEKGRMKYERPVELGAFFDRFHRRFLRSDRRLARTGQAMGGIEGSSKIRRLFS